MSDDAIQRSVLPIPDRTRVGLTTYDAKDPDTSYPPIRELRPPKGAPNVLVVLIDDTGFGASSAFGGPILHPDGRTSGRQRTQVQPLPHDGPLFADAGSPTERAQPSLGRDGQHHGDRHLGTRLQLASSEHRRPVGRDAQTQRLLDRAVRQVSRGAGLADLADGAVRQLALGRWRVRVLLWVHRRRDEPVRARRSTTTRPPSSPIGAQKRATTSRRT